MEVTGEGTPETTGYLEVVMVVVAIMMMRMTIIMMEVTTIMMTIIMMLLNLGVSNGMKEVVETLGSLEVIEPSILYFNPPTCFAQSLTSPKPEYRFPLVLYSKSRNRGRCCFVWGW